VYCTPQHFSAAAVLLTLECLNAHSRPLTLPRALSSLSPTHTNEFAAAVCLTLECLDAHSRPLTLPPRPLFPSPTHTPTHASGFFLLLPVRLTLESLNADRLLCCDAAHTHGSTLDKLDLQRGAGKCIHTDTRQRVGFVCCVQPTCSNTKCLHMCIQHGVQANLGYASPQVTTHSPTPSPTPQPAQVTLGCCCRCLHPKHTAPPLPNT
jgi:hypothetical protein